MLREIIEPKEEFLQIHIPKEYLNRKIEILIKPLEKRKLKAIDIHTKSFKFNREKANER